MHLEVQVREEGWLHVVYMGMHTPSRILVDALSEMVLSSFALY